CRRCWSASRTSTHGEPRSARWRSTTTGGRSSFAARGGRWSWIWIRAPAIAARRDETDHVKQRRGVHRKPRHGVPQALPDLEHEGREGQTKDTKRSRGSVDPRDSCQLRLATGVAQVSSHDPQEGPGEGALQSGVTDFL